MEALVGGEIWALTPTPLKSGLAAERSGSGAGAERVKKSNERSGKRDFRKWS